MNVVRPIESGRKRATTMKSFSINSDNDITVHATLKAAREAGNGSGEKGEGVFDSEAGLSELIGVDGKRLLQIWNSLTGVTPVKKFRDRATAVKRIFAELQKLSMPAAPLPPVARAAAPKEPGARPKKAAATRAPKVAHEANSAQAGGSGPRAGSKSARLIGMLKRPGGASLEEIMATFGWQIHTTRALMSAGGSLTRKHGLTVISEKSGDTRTYRIAE
jgi:hypothetical protein